MRERVYVLSSISSEFDEIDELNEIIERALYEFGDFYRQNYEIIVSRLIYCLLENKILMKRYPSTRVELYRGIKIICGNNLLRSNEILIRYKGDRNMEFDLGRVSFSCYYGDKKKIPDKVIFNKKKGATTLLFDDEVIVVKKNKNDKEDYEKAFLWAYFIKKSGLSKTQASKYIDKIMEENNASSK